MKLLRKLDGFPGFEPKESCEHIFDLNIFWPISRKNTQKIRFP